MGEYYNASFINKEKSESVVYWKYFSKRKKIVKNCPTNHIITYLYFVEEYSPMGEWRGGGGEGEFIVY